MPINPAINPATQQEVINPAKIKQLIVKQTIPAKIKQVITKQTIPVKIKQAIIDPAMINPVKITPAIMIGVTITIPSKKINDAMTQPTEIKQLIIKQIVNNTQMTQQVMGNHTGEVTAPHSHIKQDMQIIANTIMIDSKKITPAMAQDIQQMAGNNIGQVTRRQQHRSMQRGREMGNKQTSIHIIIIHTHKGVITPNPYAKSINR